jgi:hypothetical protein
MPPYKGLIGPTAQSASYMADSERLCNLYPQPTESPSAPSPWVLIPTPGFTTLTTVPHAPGRANFAENGRNFLVAGPGLYEYFADGTTILRGLVVVDEHPATIFGNGDNGGQLFITSGDRGYCYDLATNVLTQVLASGARMGAFLDGYFLALDTTTSTLQVSNLLDGMTWNPTQIAQRTAGSDRWQALYVVNRLIYLLGSATSEVWWNAGSSPFPFAPIQEAFSQFGIAATFSGAVDTALTFLGRNANGRGIVYRMNGYVPQRVSTHAIEVAIQSYARIDDAVAGITQQQGRPVYVLTFPTADTTKCLDEGTQLWHDREYWDAPNATRHAFRGMFFAALPDASVCCDRLTGNLLRIDPSVSTDVGGVLMQRIREGPRLSMEGKRFTINRLQVVMDVGLGLATGQGSNPQVMLQTSRDGGRTFGNEHWRSASAQGTFSTNVFWQSLGQFRHFTPRFVMSDPTPWRLVEAYIDVTVGRA